MLKCPPRHTHRFNNIKHKVYTESCFKNRNLYNNMKKCPSSAASFAFFVLLVSLLLMVDLSFARKAPEDYWNKIMKDQPIPEAIKGLLVQDPPASLPDHGISSKMKQFVKDFNTRSSAIIYHSHGDGEKEEKSPIDETTIHTSELPDHN